MLDIMTATQWWLSAAIVLLAYFVRGIAGFGSGLIAIPLLATLLPLTLVVPLITLLDYLASASHGVGQRQHIQARELWPLLPFILVGVVGSLYVLTHVDLAILTQALGVFVMAYALYTFVNISLKPMSSSLIAAPAGLLGGSVGTLFGTGGPFYVMYLRLRGLDKLEFRATFAAIFLLDGIGRLTGYAVNGLFDGDSVLLIVMALPVVGLGMLLGGRIHTRISTETFQKAISVLLLGSGWILLNQA